MARFRLYRPAQADLEQILATSAERWGDDARRRYGGLLVAAMRKIAADPEGPVNAESQGRVVRAFHIPPGGAVPCE